MKELEETNPNGEVYLPEDSIREPEGERRRR